MAKKSVEFKFWLNDKVSPSLARMNSALKITGKSLASVAKLGAVAFAGIGAGALAMWKTVKKAFTFETAKFQLKAVLGSMDLAVKRFDELRKFSAETPFQLPAILKASRLLTVFSEGVLGGAESLKFIGNAAAVANRGIEEVAFWVSRAYSLIQNGQPFGEAAMRLQEMGVLTPKARTEIQKLTESGADASKVWKVLKADVGRFDGAMGEMSQTGDGLISTLRDNWGIAVAAFGEKFADLAKGGLRTAINTIKELVSNGTIGRWASRAKEALTAIGQAAKIIATGSGEDRQAVFKALGGVFKAIFVDAANAMLALLSKAIPALGGAMGDAFVGVVKGVGQDKATSTQKDQAEISAFGQNVAGRPIDSKAYRDEVKKYESQNRKERYEREGLEISKVFSGGTSNFATAFAELAATTSKYSKQVAVAAKETEQAALSSNATPKTSTDFVKRAYDAISKRSATATKAGGSSYSGFESVANKIAGSDLSSQQMGLATLRAQNFERQGQESGVSGLSSTFSELIASGKSMYQATEAVNRILQGAQTSMAQGSDPKSDPIDQLVTETKKQTEIMSKGLGSIQ